MRRLACLALAVLALARVGAAPAPPSFKYVFGSTDAPDGYTRVSTSSVYSAENGAGFDLGSNFAADRAFFFSVSVPEGNYRITITLGSDTTRTDTTVKAESRRLMVERVRTAPGETVARTFTLNVRAPALPASGDAKAGEVRLNEREQGSLDWDGKLTLEFDGARPSLRTLEIAPATDAVTVFLAGDSTVTDQTTEPWNSWGQMLPRFFTPAVAVANHAESGETLKAFIAERRLEKILSQIKAGDYLFVQFGHNDMKKNWPATYADAFTTYEAYLRVFIAEARLRHAIPVLVTPVNRRTFDANGKITNSLGDYPAAVRQVARDERVALIDLNALSQRLYEALGPEEAKKAFVDATHHDNYGSYEIARCVVTGIRAAKLDLAQQLAPDVPPFDPDHPDALEAFDVPASPGRTTRAPAGN
jgi:lysophospholipase L1-like esterase